MIEIQNLSVTKNATTILSVSELAIASGERVTILGPNGSGKTTLLRVLSGLETDYQGRCAVSAPAKERVYVHQSPYLFRGTVLFNVAYGLRARGTSRKECAHSARRWLERLGIDHLAGHRVTHLSGGERRRVALARAMALGPRLLLLDEPLADMDEQGAELVCAALDELPQSTVTVASPTPLSHALTSKDYIMEATEKRND